MNETVCTKICGHFAQILKYPPPSLQDLTKECISLFDPLHKEAADLMKGFNSYLDQTHPDQRKEIYTDSLEFQAPCFPYVEYYLFGENNRRALFMSGLKEHYGIYDFSEGTDLPRPPECHAPLFCKGRGSRADGDHRLVHRPRPEKDGRPDGRQNQSIQGVLQALLLALKEGWRDEVRG